MEINGITLTKRQAKEVKIGLNKGLDVDMYANPAFTPDQMRQIREGIELGLDVSIFAKPEFTSFQMMEIKSALKDGIDVMPHITEEFNSLQIERIADGLRQGVNVKVYANPAFSYSQMNQIRCALVEGLPIEPYANPALHVEKMRLIVKALRLGLSPDVTQSSSELDRINKQVQYENYVKEGFSNEQLKLIKEGINSGMKVEIFAKPVYTYLQMCQIYLGLRDFYPEDLEAMLNPEFDPMQMEMIRLGLLEDVDVSVYAKPDIPWEDMYQMKLMLEDFYEIEDSKEDLLKQRLESFIWRD